MVVYTNILKCKIPSTQNLILHLELFSQMLFLVTFLFLLNFCLQEPPEDDANIIEKILASKTVQEVGGPCSFFSVTSRHYLCGEGFAWRTNYSSLASVKACQEH